MSHQGSSSASPIFDNSFSAFMMGVTLGVAITAILSTKEGRTLAKKVINLTSDLSNNSKNIQSDTPADFSSASPSANAPVPIRSANYGHEAPPPPPPVPRSFSSSNTYFNANGQPLKP